MFWRAIPTLEYGAWGGAKNTHSRGDDAPEPIDALDACFEQHDYALQDATTKEEEKSADYNLWKSMKMLDPSKLSRYGKFYRFLALPIFKISSWGFKPIVLDED